MTKFVLSTFLLFCIMSTTYSPLYADNDLKTINNTNTVNLSEDNSFSAPKHKPKSKRKSSMKVPKKQGEFHVGLEIGANMTSVTASQGYKDISLAIMQNGAFVSAPGIGFQAGCYFDYNLSEVIFLEVGIFGIQRNFKETATFANPLAILSVESTSSPLYARLPILLGANISLSETSSFNIKAGTYFGYGMNGKVKKVSSMVMGTTEPVTQEVSSNFFEVSEELEFGIRAGLGFEFSQKTIGFFLDYGLSNIVKNAQEGVSRKATSMGLSLGYRF